MAKVFYDKDVNWSVLKDKTVAIIGYGSQGHAHALNLKESGVNVVVGLYKGSKSADVARAAGLEVKTVAEAVAAADVTMVLIPDEKQADVYKAEIAPNLKNGSALAFAHGFNIHFKQNVTPADVDEFMVAPKGPGQLVRRTFVEGGGVPDVFAVEQDATGKCFDLALAYARGIGGTRAGVIQTTFQEETEPALLGEQAVLCGGICQLITNGFETLCEAGYQPEIAYFETFHEMKLIVDLMYEGGMAKMRKSISDTAEYGDYTAGPKVVTQDSKAAMKQVLSDIQDGTFAGKWIAENKNGRTFFISKRALLKKHQMDLGGDELRRNMIWGGDKDLDTASN